MRERGCTRVEVLEGSSWLIFFLLLSRRVFLFVLFLICGCFLLNIFVGGVFFQMPNQVNRMGHMHTALNPTAKYVKNLIGISHRYTWSGLMTISFPFMLNETSVGEDPEPGMTRCAGEGECCNNTRRFVSGDSHGTVSESG